MTATDFFWLFLIFIALQPFIKLKTMEFGRKRLLAKMEQQDPEAASAFHQIVIRLLAERAAHLIRAVNALQR